MDEHQLQENGLLTGPSRKFIKIDPKLKDALIEHYYSKIQPEN